MIMIVQTSLKIISGLYFFFKIIILAGVFVFVFLFWYRYCLHNFQSVNES